VSVFDKGNNWHTDTSNALQQGGGRCDKVRMILGFDLILTMPSGSDCRQGPSKVLRQSASGFARVGQCSGGGTYYRNERRGRDAYPRDTAE
jgi:hypothetical protein